MMGFASDLIQMNIGQIFQKASLPAVDLTGQTIVITGANSGVGLEAAKHFYSLNASRIILACRNMNKGDQARGDVIASGGTLHDGKVEVWELDMSKYSSVMAFGDRLNSLPRIDAFLANAGIDVSRWEVYEGYESTLTVNVISTFLLAMLAIPKLRETSSAQRRPSNLVITGSVGHIFAQDKYLSEPAEGQIFETLNDESSADMGDRYHLTKLLGLMCVHQLAEKVVRESKEGRASFVVNYVHPGWCKTELFRSHDAGVGFRTGLYLIGKTAEEGGRTLVHAAVAGEETHGRYLAECRIKPESAFMTGSNAPIVEKRVWAELLSILENIQPGVTR